MELFVEPRVVKTWNQFVKESPSYSIALDGYVKGKPMFDINGPYANFNHHEGVDGLSTRSTCGQVYLALKQGFLSTYMKDGKVHGNIFVNDPDYDACLAVWLLQNPERIQGRKSEPRINRLVFIEDMLDSTGGAYPFDPFSDTIKRIAWVFEPYTSKRVAGKVHNLDKDSMSYVINNVSKRISEHVSGKGSMIEPDFRYEKIGGGKDWIMIYEIGAHARSKLFFDGVKAFVSVIDNNDGTYNYTVARISHFVNFPIREFYSKLNVVENLIPNSADCWSGGDMRGGSPRKSGSKLDPETLEKVINECLKQE